MSENEILAQLYSMARLRKLDLDVGTDDLGEWFEFIFPLIDERGRMERVADELQVGLGVQRLTLSYSLNDRRIRVHLANCTPKEVVSS